MKVLVQREFNQTYLKRTGTWTSNPDEAMSFRNSQEAMDYCLAHALHDLRIVLKFGDPRYDVHLKAFTTPYSESASARPRPQVALRD